MQNSIPVFISSLSIICKLNKIEVKISSKLISFRHNYLNTFLQKIKKHIDKALVYKKICRSTLESIYLEKAIKMISTGRFSTSTRCTP